MIFLPNIILLTLLLLINMGKTLNTFTLNCWSCLPFYGSENIAVSFSSLPLRSLWKTLHQKWLSLWFSLFVPILPGFSAEKILSAVEILLDSERKKKYINISHAIH